MPRILFVHGTGVRLSDYDVLLSVVRREAARRLPGVAVHPCLWGAPYGARLNAAGASIPTYDDTAAKPPSQAEIEAVEEATGRMLSEDPLFEIRLLESIPAPRRELAPGEIGAGMRSFELLRTLAPGGDLLALLREKELDGYWTAAHARLMSDPELEVILRSANRDPREISRALARAMIASLMGVAAERGYPAISAPTREVLTDLLIPHLGGHALAVFDWVTRPVLGIARNIASRFVTYKARRSRRALSDVSYPAAGDVILYQARGTTIRQFILDRLNECDEVIVIAHSLGGIAMVDLLIQNDLSDRVKGLVTVGSQAPFLYEINALVSLPYGQRLPPHFPRKWLNIWDPNDFLSYIAAGVFGPDAVTDLRVVSGLPFPESHSAYWDQNQVWTTIQQFFPWT